MAGHHRLAAVRAHCHELDGDHDAAAAEYRAAARTATSLPERRYLEARAARLAGTGGPARAAGTTGAAGHVGGGATTGQAGCACALGAVEDRMPRWFGGLAVALCMLVIRRTRARR